MNNPYSTYKNAYIRGMFNMVKLFRDVVISMYYDPRHIETATDMTDLSFNHAPQNSQ